MIAPKIKTLFQFIEYLHSNIENFNQYNDLIKELEQLDKERNQLKTRNNYKDKQQYDKVQAQLESKFKTLQENTAHLIKAKARELNLCNFDNEPNYSFNGVETEIRQLKDNFSNEDLPEILKHKSQYIKYRSNTHCTFLSLQFFFNELDEIAKSLFDYFKEDISQNEFEPFETKAIEVNSIAEAAQRFNKQRPTKFIIPNFMGKTQNRILEKLANFNFFQIEVIADLEFEGETYKDVKQKNNDSILTTENWEQYKGTFYTQRMATYKDSYTLAEKIKLELSRIEKLPINETDYQILKDRYRAHLEQIQTLPPQPIDKQQNRTKQVIAETFENMDKKGWQYAFSTEQDYNLFTNLLTNFFEYKDYSIPETAIQPKRSCKTKVAKALGEIHKELSNENKLSTDTEYFNIIRVLSHFQNEKERDLYKALTR
jgi:phosphoglycolate phosphatase-like HAD superfamily hydrolase|tara:strand:+ start:1953 stop:3236 length:1284 start_codon:yes stop_codon:yes gene_type:complete